MKIIIAGSRSINISPKGMESIVQRAEEALGSRMTELVCGMAPGVDSCAYDWRKYHNVVSENHIGIKEMPADWEGARVKFGSYKSAGHVRNARMADYADALILIWNGSSPGSSSMYQEANSRGLPILEMVITKK